MTILLEDPYKNFTLAEMYSARPQFFKNAPTPEKYRVRKNHLIVKQLSSGTIKVWQFVYINDMYRLRLIWYPPSEMSLREVITEVEWRVASGQWPLSAEVYVNQDTGEAYNENNGN